MSDLLGFTTPRIEAATSDTAWIAAMLEVEAALARAGERTGSLPPAAAAAIVHACSTVTIDSATLAESTRTSATPIIALVDHLRAAVPASAAPFVHHGATSQDIIDTAMCLVAARSIDIIDADISAATATLAGLARSHRETRQIGRTLLQHAAPTAFGLTCAGWLIAVDEAAGTLDRVRRDRLAVQLGGPAGTLAGYPDRGAEITALMATALGLAVPVLPWHTSRGRVTDLAGALGGLAAALATIALDVTLLAQPEIGEVADARPGTSSSMPHKRNPARAVMVIATAHRAPGLVATLFAGAPQEWQRAAGRWQAEWATMTDLLRVTGSAAAHTRAMLSDLTVDAARMRANLDAAALPGDQAAATRAAGAWIDRALAAHAPTTDAAGKGTADGRAGL